jgi:hypothetical protein
MKVRGSAQASSRNERHAGELLRGRRIARPAPSETSIGVELQEGSMKTLLKSALGAGFLALAACGGQGDDSLGDNAADAADAQADVLDQAADNATTEGQEDSLQAQADALREQGEAKEEAIDDADVNADAMTPAQKDAATNGQ